MCAFRSSRERGSFAAKARTLFCRVASSCISGLPGGRQALKRPSAVATAYALPYALTGGLLVYGQLRVLRDRVSLVPVLAAVVLAHAMVMALKALGAEGLNGAVLEAQPLVRYAAIGNALMFDWRGVLSLAVYEELLIYGVWIRGLAGSAIWKTAVVVCTTVVVLLIGVVMTLGMH